MIAKIPFLPACFLLLSLAAFLVSYVKIQKTIIGYQLGSFKKNENALLFEKTRLKMELAQITQKKTLLKFAHPD